MLFLVPPSFVANNMSEISPTNGKLKYCHTQLHSLYYHTFKMDVEESAFTVEAMEFIKQYLDVLTYEYTTQHSIF